MHRLCSECQTGNGFRVGVLSCTVLHVSPLKVWSHLFLLKTYFSLDLFRSGSSQWGQSMCLNSLFLAFVSGYLHSLGQKLSTFCSMFPIFLSVLFLQRNSDLCCRTCGITGCWILGTLVLSFWPSLLRIFWQHINGHHLFQRDWKLSDSASLFGL